MVNDRLPESELQGLAPLGHGKLRFFGLHIYDASLFVDKAAPLDTKNLGEAKFALALRYARELEGSKIAERSEAEMAKQKTSNATEREEWLKQMKNIFPNVKQGDVLTGSYSPNKGTRFFLNGRLIGDIEGARFAENFFGIWLSEKTSDPTLRKSLLAQPPSKS